MQSLKKFTKIDALLTQGKQAQNNEPTPHAGAQKFYELAVQFEKDNNPNQAIRAYKQAVRLNPDFAQGHHGLGVLYEKHGNALAAIDHYQIATTRSPDDTLFWQSLARARYTVGRYDESLSAIRQAYKVSDDKESILPLYAALFEKVQSFEIDEQLIEEAIACNKSPNINNAQITRILHQVILHRTLSTNLIPADHINNLDDFETVLKKGESINWEGLNEKEFTALIAPFPVRSHEIETRLTILRKHCLNKITQDNSGKTLWNNAPIFLSALALQCFFNEYLFFETKEEKQTLETLETRVVEGQNLSLHDILIYSCYRPLYKLPRAQDLLEKLATIDAIKDFVRITLAEPLEEKALKKDIKTITSIDNEISQLVKEQYEQNPYPRWSQLRKGESFDFKGVMQHLFSHLEDNRFNNINLENTRTLIAGCGTGKQSINASQTFENSDILAIDLSATSIAYAMRKTKEAEIENIEYAIADILKLEELNEQFDVIQCGGVLHHMEDPEKGWSILNKCLKPGGFMLIALYSEIARKSILDAHKFIKKQGYTTEIDSIRNCRRAIQNLHENDPVKAVTSWVDFYAASDCRDLIFHVQESHYTTLKIKDIIKDLNLEFLGFSLAERDTLQKYPLRFPDDPTGINLENWHIFEQENPETFRGMYQFWLQKPCE